MTRERITTPAPPRPTLGLSLELKAWRDRLAKIHRMRGLEQCPICKEAVPDLASHERYCKPPNG
jgi:hypothetical protein